MKYKLVLIREEKEQYSRNNNGLDATACFSYLAFLIHDTQGKER